MTPVDPSNICASDLAVIGGRGMVVDKDRTGDWSQTWTGKRFYPLDPRPEDIDIKDIIFSLGNVSRYAGHCMFYSVAEHSVLVSFLVPEELAFEGLMHDADEPYIQDFTRPNKRALGPDNIYFKIVKDVREKALAPKFGLAPEIPLPVKHADTQICIVEKRQLHPRSDPWFLPYPDPRHLRIQGLRPPYSQWVFLKRYCELTGANEITLRNQMEDLMMEDRAAMYGLPQER